MPIYEYQCGDCGHGLESLQKLSDPPLTDCPGCGKPTLQKQISAAGFRLAGGGWYETDFKSGSKRNVADKDASKDTHKDTSGKDTSSGSSGGLSGGASGGGHGCGDGGSGPCS